MANLVVGFSTVSLSPFEFFSALITFCVFFVRPFSEILVLSDFLAFFLVGYIAIFEASSSTLLPSSLFPFPFLLRYESL